MKVKRRDILKLAPLALAPAAWPAQAGGRKQRLLYFSRSAGFEHGVVKRENGRPSVSDAAMEEIGNLAGFEVECTKDGGVFDGGLDQYDAFAFYTSGDLTKPSKDGAPPMTLRGKQRLLDAVATGKGFIGIHSATDTFHSDGPRFENQEKPDPYIAMLGAEFIAHGPQQEAALMRVSKFPTGWSEGISFTDEWYTMKNYARDLHVILVQETTMMKGDCYRRPHYPIVWARPHGQGRVYYCGLGHTTFVWKEPFFREMLTNGIDWAMGNKYVDITPNIAQVTPGANQFPAPKGKKA